MLGRTPGFGVVAVLIEGAEGNENRDEDAGERCSPDESDELERAEKLQRKREAALAKREQARQSLQGEGSESNPQAVDSTPSPVGVTVVACESDEQDEPNGEKAAPSDLSRGNKAVDGEQKSLESGLR